MTSTLSRNAVTPTEVTRLYSLRANKEGFPINKQVPRTIQTYTGVGGVGVTLDYDGSNDVVVFAENLTGDLIIRFCPSAINDKYNLLGKDVKIHINGATTRSITLNSSPSFMKINATALTQLSHVITGNGLSKTITVSFVSLNLWNLDYGASAIYSFPTNLPSMSFQRVSYTYGRFSSFFVPSVYIPDNSVYSVLFGELNRETEGYIFPGTEITSVQGPGQQIVYGVYIAASQRTEPTNIYGYLYQGSVYFGTFIVQMSPILSNVYDFPYFTGANSDGTLKMLRLDDTNVDRIALDAEGNTVKLDGDLVAIANSIADSIYFSVYSTSNTVIQYESFVSPPFTEVLLDVSTLSSAFWTAAAKISDIEYDEKNRCLYVLPDLNNALLLRIPILPMDEVNRFQGPVITGSFTSRLLNIAGGQTPHSIAVCPLTSAIYIGHSRLVGNVSIAVYQDFNSLSLSFLYTHPSISTRDVIVGFTALGQLVIHYERDLSVVTLERGRPLSNTPGDIINVFTLNSYSPSLSRTCYGWNQG